MPAHGRGDDLHIPLFGFEFLALEHPKRGAAGIAAGAAGRTPPTPIRGSCIRVQSPSTSYEPPVQINPKYMALDDVEVGEVTIPKGSRIVLPLAAANRDPNRDPNRFPDPDDSTRSGQTTSIWAFLTGIHYCFGAGLARQEAQVALTELARRLENPPAPAGPAPVPAESHAARAHTSPDRDRWGPLAGT